MKNKVIKNCLLLATSIVSLNVSFLTQTFAQSQNQLKFVKGQLMIKLDSLSEANLVKIANFAKSQKAIKITSLVHSTAIINLDKDINSQVKDFLTKVNFVTNNLNVNASPARLKRVKSQATSSSKNNLQIIFPESINVEQLMGLFAGRPSVSEISLNHQVNLHSFPNNRFVDSDQNGQLDNNSTTGIPWAWHLSNIGAEQPKSQSGRGIVVAAIDEGTIEETSPDSRKQLINPELQDQLWVNPREIPNDGIDNDSNGFVDDMYGVNMNADEECDTKKTNCRAVDRSVPWSHPEDFHVVAVASLIAAKANNGIGLAGVVNIPRALSQTPGTASSSTLRQNPANRFDTNGDGVVGPLDALIVVNVLNGGASSSNFFVDVNGDQMLSPLDALLVINFLNSRR